MIARMTTPATIAALPDWPHAGKKVKDAPENAIWRTETVGMAAMQFAVIPNNRAGLSEYTVIGGYLIPHYPPDPDKRQHRDEELLKKRVKRFFYSSEKGIDVECTAAELDADMQEFEQKFAAVSAARRAAGQPEFSLSIPYRQMSAGERELLSRGAVLVGHAVNRLGRIGCIIIQGNRDGVKIEHDDDYIATHMSAIQKEFKTLWAKLTDEANVSLVRCVLTRDGAIDYDGVFHHLIREIGKPVLPYLGSVAKTAIADVDMTADWAPVQAARNNIVGDIGKCLGAIDEMALNLRRIEDTAEFANLLKRAQAAPARTRELELSDYPALSSEYVELCRARASIKSEDTPNFMPLAARLRFIGKELELQHRALLDYARISNNGTGVDALELLMHGTHLIGDMTELHLPRNHTALDVYDRETEAFTRDPRTGAPACLDASSVGRLTSKIDEWFERSQVKLGAVAS